MGSGLPHTFIKILIIGLLAFTQNGVLAEKNKISKFAFGNILQRIGSSPQSRSDRPLSRRVALKGGATEEVPLEEAPVQEAVAPHALSTSECLSYFGVVEDEGLSAEVAEERLKKYGRNELVAAEATPLWKLVLEQFEDRLVQILLVVAVMSGALAYLEGEEGGFVEPTVILSILVINAVIGVWQSKSAEDSLEALKKLQPDTACVLRGGSWIGELPAQELVPGDVIYMRVGDKIPSDARVLGLKTTTFKVDEGSLTGESVTVSKSTDPVDADSPIQGKTNMVFSGTMVTNGAAFAVVTATGMSTEIGKIQEGVQEAKEDAEKTPLAQKLDDFGNQLTIVIGIICLGVWAISAPKFGSPIFGGYWKGALYYAKVAVALGVAAIPEGLPAVITLCLSLGTRRMAKRNVIVRKLPSVETLGCTTVICTDKTGTLTTNQMTSVSLVTIAADGLGNPTLKEYEVEGVSYDPKGSVVGLGESAMTQPAFQDLARVCSMCNDAQVVYEGENFKHLGEPTEAALKVLVEKLGVPGLKKSDDLVEICRQCNDYWAGDYKKMATLEFSRDRKSMSVIVKGQNGKNRLFVKGAPEMLLTRCTKVMLPSGTVVPMTDAFRKEILAKNSEMATRPLRCLGMAVKEGEDMGVLSSFTTESEGEAASNPLLNDPKNFAGIESGSESEGEAASNPLLNDPKNFAGIESGLTFLGLTGIKDPARPEVAESINICTRAGIRVIVITGDSKDTAIAIARDCNIFGPDEDVSDRAFIGADFFKLPVEEQQAKLRTGNLLFCRTEPADKQKLVKMLEKLDEIPAMTGDGVNDAPALQQAAIGVAMGITGTEVAKEAADMVLADDNFATIVNAVEEGRCIYNNMQSFICFLISCNLGEIATIFFSTLLGLPEPLTPLHLLWVNLVTDGPPATALGFNPPDPDAMYRPPRPTDEPIMSKWMFTRYCVTGLYVGCATIGAFLWWYLAHGVSFNQVTHWGQCTTWPAFHPDYVEGFNVIDDPCSIFTAAKSVPQTMALSVLVTMEMLKALAAISVDNSLLKVQPWSNKWLILGVAVPFTIHVSVLYNPILNKIFGTAPLSWDEWKVVLAFSAPVMIVEEILKFIGRRINAKKMEERVAQIAAAKASLKE
eukprot:CAMPEP_0117769178 /NCGR_PEP_ID=MMETSP0947-20121206/22864_1 /TAXON_ID=44440 /ORGANISM="Chattonella subsalsa, Strain CCMP2191" /LENGTH=1124 /DNA_ID=CAMNT_0005593597 /DNA_START=59 /DNA_END=3434 /DNA_ORIENTATION=-